MISQIHYLCCCFAVPVYLFLFLLFSDTKYSMQMQMQKVAFPWDCLIAVEGMPKNRLLPNLNRCPRLAEMANCWSGETTIQENNPATQPSSSSAFPSNASFHSFHSSSPLPHLLPLSPSLSSVPFTFVNLSGCHTSHLTFPAPLPSFTLLSVPFASPLLSSSSHKSASVHFLTFSFLFSYL